ncbi:MAG: hypothetical protein ACUVTM_04995 [Candidatus Bathyarchaeia archaeon]
MYNPTWIHQTLILTGTTLLLQTLTRSRTKLRYTLLLIGLPIGLWALTLGLLNSLRGHLDPSTSLILTISGVALTSKTLSRIRWAAILALTSGASATYYFNLITGHITVTPMLLIFLASTLLTYLLLKFAEDLIAALGTIFQFPPASFMMGLTCLIWTLKLTLL